MNSVNTYGACCCRLWQYRMVPWTYFCLSYPGGLIRHFCLLQAPCERVNVTYCKFFPFTQQVLKLVSAWLLAFAAFGRFICITQSLLKRIRFSRKSVGCIVNYPKFCQMTVNEDLAVSACVKIPETNQAWGLFLTHFNFILTNILPVLYSVFWT